MDVAAAEVSWGPGPRSRRQRGRALRGRGATEAQAPGTGPRDLSRKAGPASPFPRQLELPAWGLRVSLTWLFNLF